MSVRASGLRPAQAARALAWALAWVLAWVLTWALPAAAAEGALRPLEDAALLEALQGAWCNSHDGGRSCWAWDRFSADGRLRACGRTEDDPRPFDGRGRVTVSGQTMCYVVEQASANFWLAPGRRYCTRIVAIGEHEHVYEDLDSGRRFTLYRRPASAVDCPPVDPPGPQVLDLPTRAGVTQRMLLIEPPRPRAAVVLLPGGHGGLQIFDGGSMKWGDGNFLVRTRQRFVDHGLAVALLDSPSDRQRPPFLESFRHSAEHVADLRAVIAMLRRRLGVPVWLVGTSRGTQSVAYAATELQGADAPDGIVLSSTIVADEPAPATPAVPALPLARIRVPVLLVHHEHDRCRLCRFSELPALLKSLSGSPRAELARFTGGTDGGNPCGASGFHGYNGIEAEVVARIAAWITAR